MQAYYSVQLMNAKTTTGKKILLVDDESDILEFLKYNLEKEGFQVQTASNGREGVAIAHKFLPQLILLDVMMPGMDGIETCQLLRETEKLKDTVIAFLTARSEDYSQIAGFDAGADDYISKPIKPKVLVSRINALLRRKNMQPMQALTETNGIQIDPDRFIVVRNGEELNLPRKEFQLLKLLMSKPGNVFTREHILSDIWGQEIIVGNRTIDVHIRKLREKLGDEYIQTIKGVGYKFTG
ncbi:MAG: Phosphate regulon transcriptional regulatory protein PhoB [Bacteroidia bacterium]|nr:Phosphate regulon transcriptional regulatory protein PhoB [Bacteroidia bacterium]